MGHGDSLHNVYQKKGWNLTLGYHPYLIDSQEAFNAFDSEYLKKQYALEAHKYSEEEITHTLTRAIENQHVSISDAEVLGLKPERVEMVRKYCLLDLVANYGRPIPDNETTGCLMVAGYKTLWGLPQAEVIQIALEKIPKLDFLWETKLAPFSDIQWLVDKGFIRSK